MYDMNVFVILVVERLDSEIFTQVFLGSTEESAKKKLADSLRYEIELNPEKYAHLMFYGIGNRDVMSDSEIIDAWFNDEMNSNSWWESFRESVD